MFQNAVVTPDYISDNLVVRQISQHNNIMTPPVFQQNYVNDNTRPVSRHRALYMRTMDSGRGPDTSCLSIFSRRGTYEVNWIQENHLLPGWGR